MQSRVAATPKIAAFSAAATRLGLIEHLVSVALRVRYDHGYSCAAATAAESHALFKTIREDSCDSLFNYSAPPRQVFCMTFMPPKSAARSIQRTFPVLREIKNLNTPLWSLTYRGRK